MSPLARMLGSWARIQVEAWMYTRVSSEFVFTCIGSSLATGWSLVQRVQSTVCKKNAVFWDVAPCTSCVNRHFGGTIRWRRYVPLKRRFTQDLHDATLFIVAAVKTSSLTNCLKDSYFQINSEWEQAREPNPLRRRRYKMCRTEEWRMSWDVNKLK
jgi:hypothetical protein